MLRVLRVVWHAALPMPLLSRFSCCNSQVSSNEIRTHAFCVLCSVFFVLCSVFCVLSPAPESQDPTGAPLVTFQTPRARSAHLESVAPPDTLLASATRDPRSDVPPNSPTQRTQ
jgi:hypothetical protein